VDGSRCTEDLKREQQSLERDRGRETEGERQRERESYCEERQMTDVK
jgi:hypothetical protein